MNPFLRALLDRRATLQERQDAIVTEAETRVAAEREAADEPANVRMVLTEDEETRFGALSEEMGPLDVRIAQLQDAEERGAAAARAAGDLEGPAARVTSEPLTYRRNGPNSFFRDRAAAMREGGNDPEARNRLEAHQREMDVIREERADMDRTDGTGGEFVPPIWLMDMYVALARAGRVTADLCRALPLPGGTDSINLPKIATGTAVAAQTDNASVQNTAATTTSVSAGVKTFAGQQKFALQLLEQSPLNFDEVIFADLIADHAVRIDAAVIAGAGSPSFSGLLGTGSIIAVTYTDASPTVPELYPKVADSIQQINTNRFLPPQAIVMHPRRWAWMLASLDSNNRPLVVPNAQGPNNAFAGMSDVRAEGSVGTLQGLPVYVDANVPINLGAGTNEDRIIVARFDDLFLFEGPLRTRVLFETDADTLEVRLQVWNYAAFLATRLPKAIAVIAGTGLVTPTF